MPKLRVLRCKWSRDVAEALKWYISKFGSGGDINLVCDVECIRADAGPQFSSDEFCQACAETGIHLTLAAPEHQEQNTYAERTWQTVRILAWSMMEIKFVPQNSIFGNMASTALDPLSQL